LKTLYEFPYSLIMHVMNKNAIGKSKLNLINVLFGM